MKETTNVNLTPEVVETVYNLQQRGYAEGWIKDLQDILERVILGDLGDEAQRLRFAENLLGLQSELRNFIPQPEEKEGGAQ